MLFFPDMLTNLRPSKSEGRQYEENGPRKLQDVAVLPDERVEEEEIEAKIYSILALCLPHMAQVNTSLSAEEGT